MSDGDDKEKRKSGTKYLKMQMLFPLFYLVWDLCSGAVVVLVIVSALFTFFAKDDMKLSI